MADRRLFMRVLGRSSRLVVAFFFLSWTACAEPPGEGDGFMEVHSGRDLAVAFASSSQISTAVLLTDVFMKDADWEGVLGGPNRSEPVLLSRNFTIIGSPSLPSWPLLNMGFVHAKVRIGNNVTLVVRHVVVGDFRSDLLTRAPGFDLAAPTYPPRDSPGRLLHNETAVFYRVCLPKDIWVEGLITAPRSIVSPGNQTFRLGLPQTGCLQNNGTSLAAAAAGSRTGAITMQQLAAVGLPHAGLKIHPPLQSWCWADRGVFDDVAVPGYDLNAFGTTVPNNYDTLLRNVSYMCANVMPMECVKAWRLLGCAQRVMADAPGDLPWRLPSPTNSSSVPSPPTTSAPSSSSSPSPTPSRSADASASASTRLEIWNGRDLAVAFAASPRITTAVLMTDVWMADADWTGVLGGADGSDPVLLSHDFTITSSPDLPTWPLLNMAFVRSKIRIASSVTLTVRRIVVGDFRYNLITQSPGFDLAAPTVLSTYDTAPGVLLHDGTMVMYSVCFPAVIWRDAVLNASRASSKPGNQSAVFNIPQDGCINVTQPDGSGPGSVPPPVSRTTASPASLAAIAAGTAPGLKLLPPLQSRCWADRGVFKDVVVKGADVDVYGKTVPNNYDVLLQNVTYMCANVMSMDCIRRWGPLVCATMLLNRTSDPLPWRLDPSKLLQETQTPSGDDDKRGEKGDGDGDRDSKVVVVAATVGTVGGVALLAIIAGAVFVVFRRRGRSRSKCGPADSRDPLAKGKSLGADDLESAPRGGGCLPWTVFSNPTAATATACGYGRPTGKSSSTATPSGDSAADSPDDLPGGGVNGGDGAGGGEGVRPYVGIGFSGSGGGEESGGGPGKSTCNPLASSTLQDSKLEDCGSARGGAAPASCASRSEDQSSNPTSRSGDASSQRQRRAPGGAAVAPAPAPLNSQPYDDEHVVVTPLTPPRPDLALGEAAAKEVTLLPVVRGKGAFGRVYEGLYGGERVAVKVMRDVGEAGAVGDGKGGGGGANALDHVRASFAQEVEVLGRCQHPNVVRLLAACVEPPRLLLVMELMQTSLEKLVYNKAAGLMPLTKVLYIALDIARGLEYLHPTILHRDLKPANILVNEPDSPRPIAKITDFGVSRLRSTVLVTKHPEAGTPAYMAPETFDVKNYTLTHHVDIYSIGVILWVMLTGEHPWRGLTMVEVAYKVTINRERLKLDAVQPPSRCPARLRALVEQCWEHEPRRRPAAAEVVKELQFLIDVLQQQ